MVGIATTSRTASGKGDVRLCLCKFASYLSASSLHFKNSLFLSCGVNDLCCHIVNFGPFNFKQHRFGLAPHSRPPFPPTKVVACNLSFTAIIPRMI